MSPRVSSISCLALATAAGAQSTPHRIQWVDWMSSTPTAVSGRIDTPTGPVDVIYEGQRTFVQANGGTDYWLPSSPYASVTAPNPPIGPDIIAVTGGGSSIGRFTFSRPVRDPVLAVVSLGTYERSVRYIFTVPITVLSTGHGFFGSGAFTVSGTTLTGREGHGTIRIPGVHSQIQFSMPDDEHWHGFRIGTSESDLDGDGVNDLHDNCLEVPNSSQADCDNAGPGDACSPDCDADGLPDPCALVGGDTDYDGNGIPDTCDCLADVDGDRTIDAEDLAAVLFGWGMSGPKAGLADITLDGTIDGNDLAAILAGWGDCPG